MTLTYDVQDSIFFLMKTVFHGNIAELFPVNLAQTPKQKMCQFPIHFVEKKIHFGNGSESYYFVSVLFLIWVKIGVC